jgi:hypothetical protein
MLQNQVPPVAERPMQGIKMQRNFLVSTSILRVPNNTDKQSISLPIDRSAGATATIT